MKKDLKLKALELRKKGYSIKELKDIIGVSKSTLSLWTKNIKLSPKAQGRLNANYTKGQLASQKSVKEKTKEKNLIANIFAQEVLNKTVFSKSINIVICAMIWWCEGNKGVKSAVTFTNSDPELVKFFLHTFRAAFHLDESKFRVLMHLHSYHDEVIQKNFWSKVTKVSKKQFHKSYLKPSSGKYKKENYQGCIKLVYNDVIIARNLEAVAKLTMERYK